MTVFFFPFHFPALKSWILIFTKNSNGVGDQRVPTRIRTATGCQEKQYYRVIRRRSNLGLLHFLSSTTFLYGPSFEGGSPSSTDLVHKSKTMCSNLEAPPSNGCENVILSEEQDLKIREVRRLLGPLSGKSSIYCSDSSISRYLRARNWNVKKATKMLKATLKWRSEYKPEEIQWDEVAHEAETGKIYRANYNDRQGRTVIVMRPCRQNSKSVKGQIRYLVYCMENAILNLPPDQESMIWLIDFKDFDMSNISLKATKETAHVLQEHYPERLGFAILYNAPKFFEPFWMVAKPFLDTKTANKVKFVYSHDVNSKRIVEDLFDTDQLESAFGGNNNVGFNVAKYAEMMKEDDKQMRRFWSGVNPTTPASEKAQSSSALVNESKTSNISPKP